ncbi:hypothetical protein, partial [Saccharothrix longispora]|uniref:hypothetical protein n=1 Tax=Saccharothrix longispora TaxID=33920 RepID=UPI0028FD14F5
PIYNAHPFQQLAAVQYANGHEADARKTLIAQQRFLEVEGDLGNPLRQLGHRTSGFLLGYGYQPFRSALALVTVVGLLALLAMASGSRVGCDSFAQRFSFAVSGAFAPLRLTSLGTCSFEASQYVVWLVWWILQLTAWGLIVLIVAGYTGLIRRAR